MYFTFPLVGGGEIHKTKNEHKGGYISANPSLFALDYRPTTCMCKVIHTTVIFIEAVFK